MPPTAKNQNQVPVEDLSFFCTATAEGIRQQLRAAGHDTSGLKYELYLRLIANGLRLYNDTRASALPEADSPDPEASSSGAGNGRKHARADDEEDIEQPAAKRIKRRTFADIPAEIALRIIDNLDLGGIFNLAAVVPDEFLSDNKVNAFLIEAERRKRPGERTGQSLLEWVLQRTGNEVDFRTGNRNLIKRVVETYMGSYVERSEEARVEEIMWYYRDAGGSPLFYAVRRGLPDMVYLLILTGEDTNESVSGATPLDEATRLVSDRIRDVDRLHVVFALLAGGADTTTTDPGTLGANGVDTGSTADAAGARLGEIRPTAPAATTDPAGWPAINNPRGLTVLRFLADERSPFLDRATMALYLIAAKTTTYPGFQLEE
ncbi:hypothetical protein diail_2840 [Diaporthe ilicicola]|nr:hypothetical protein diail_2840 [Diaporthe ilicicola]